MNLGCSFKQSNLFHGIECRRCKTLDFVHSRSRFRGFGHKYLGALRPISGIHLSKNARRIGGVRGCSKKDFDDHLCGSRLRTPMLGGLGSKLEMSTSVLRCQSSDDAVYLDGNGRNVELGKDSKEESLKEEDNPMTELNDSRAGKDEKEAEEEPPADELRESLQKARRDLEVARLNSEMFEEKAQKISETAIALKDEAENARNDVDRALKMIEEVVNQELNTKEAVQKATMALSLAEARLQVALESVKTSRSGSLPSEGLAGSDSDNQDREEVTNLLKQEEESLLASEEEIKECKLALEKCEAELTRLHHKKVELLTEVDRLREVAEQAQMNALKAEDDVANIMLLAEQAVALELEAAQRVHDAEIALQRAEKHISSSQADVADSTDYQSVPSLSEDGPVEEEIYGQGTLHAHGFEGEKDLTAEGPSLASQHDGHPNVKSQSLDDATVSDGWSDKEIGNLGKEADKDADFDVERVKDILQTKKGEAQKDMASESSPSSTPKASVKKSSRFFSASFFSFDDDSEEFAPSSVFRELMDSAKKQLPKLIVGLLLFGAGVTYYLNRAEKGFQLLQQPDIVTTSIEEVSSDPEPLIQNMQKIPKRLKKLIERLPHQEISAEEASLFDVLWLLLASVIFVPAFQKIPGGSPVLGYLAAGILIGPHGLSIIRHVHGTKAVAEFGVVFLLFNIGLELSVERLSSMKKYVFGLGSAQVLSTAAAVGLVAHFLCGHAGPAAIVIGNGLALSSTAVVLQAVF
uniref:Cation/H+ exchanger transmembrane domain-containing protein n=1 Tax=Opuntia streptacantha TaxID=393608 RepID=A0A7C8YHH8_OPUST